MNYKHIILAQPYSIGSLVKSSKLDYVFLIEITSKKEGNEGVSGGRKKKSKRTKKKSKRKKKSNKLQKKKKRTPKKNIKVPISKCKLYYFTMNGCPYCEEFNPIWNDLINLVPKLKTEKIERSEKPEMVQNFNIETFPNIILMKNNKKEIYKNERNTNTLIEFLKSNITNMV